MQFGAFSNYVGILGRGLNRGPGVQKLVRNVWVFEGFSQNWQLQEPELSDFL